MPTDNAIMSRFCKSGDLHSMSRRFHNLSKEGRRAALAMIRDGEGSPAEVDAALRRAKRDAANARGRDFEAQLIAAPQQGFGF